MENNSKLIFIFVIILFSIYIISSTITDITWENPTPINGNITNESFVFLNTSITSDTCNSSAWFDWNKSLVCYWSFDYYNDTGIFDNSSYGNFGEFNGLTANNITSGVRGNAIILNGSANGLDIPDITKAENWSISAWIKSYPCQGILCPIVGIYDLDIISSTHKIRTGGSGVYSNSAVPIGQWTHVAITCINNNATFYQNGTYDGSSSFQCNDSLTFEYVGKSTLATWNFNGSLDEVMIFNRGLSQQEIKALYNNTANRLYNNFTNLTKDQTYNYNIYSIDSKGNLNITDERSVKIDNPYTLEDCGTLDSSNNVYTLTSNVSSQGTCFTIAEENITLDCNGYWINYSIAGTTNTQGIISYQFNTTVRNCNIVDGNMSDSDTNRHGIFFQSAANYSTLENNNVKTSNGRGIFLYQISHCNLINNFAETNSSLGIFILGTNDINLTGNTGISSSSNGIAVYSSNSYLRNNTAKSNSSYAISVYGGYVNSFLINNTLISNSSGISLNRNSNHTLINNTLIINGTGNAIYFTEASGYILISNNATITSGYGTYLDSSFNNTLENNIFTTNGNNRAIFLYSGSSNNTLINNTGRSVGGIGIFLLYNSDNNTLINNTGISNTSTGIRVQSSFNNTLTGNLGTSNASYGIDIYFSYDNTLTNNNGTNFGNSMGMGINSAYNNTLMNNIGMSLSNSGVYIKNSFDNILINQTAITTGTSGTRVGIYILSSNNTIIRDCFNVSGATADVYVHSDSGSINNTFINCSYDISKETVNGAGNELIRQWYYQAYVNDSSGNALEEVRVNAYNGSGGLSFTAISNSNGLIDAQNLTEYVNYGGTRVYQNNYNFSFQKTGYYTNYSEYNLSYFLNNLDYYLTLILEPVQEEDSERDSFANPNPTITNQISSKNLEQGYEKSFRKNSQIKFQFNNQETFARVSSISDDKVVVEIKDKKYEININQTKKIDLDDDGVYDLEINTDSIVNYGTIARMKFTSISEPIISDEEEPVEEHSKQNIITEPFVDEKGENKKGDFPSFIIGIVVGVGILIVLIQYLVMKGRVKFKRKNKKTKNKKFKHKIKKIKELTISQPAVSKFYNNALKKIAEAHEILEIETELNKNSKGKNGK